MSEQTHATVRTSPIGEKYRGRCLLCGKDDLTTKDVREEDCPNPTRVSQEDALLMTLEALEADDE